LTPGLEFVTGPSALIVDADPDAGAALSELLAREGVRAHCVASAASALSALEERPFVFVVAALELSGPGGDGLFASVPARWPGTPLVVTSSCLDTPETDDARRWGALDVLAKPFEADEVAHVTRKALAVGARTEAVPEPSPVMERLILGHSRTMAEVFELLKRVARGRTTVLIRGESGTGKDLAARALHDLGPRKAGPFVKIDCTALPEALLESELFGHERGAFTGASRCKAGRVELAEGGTLFLDEIGELSAPVQAKLLRLIQDQEFERLGGTVTLRVDVRVIAATHRDLEQMVEAHDFREDLFYRLNVVPLWMPPLRARRDDIEPLVRRFIEVFAEANGRLPPEIEPSALRLLRRERWPGNVRQLQNLVERLVVLADGPVLLEKDVRAELVRKQGGFETEPWSTEAPAAARDAAPPGDGSLDHDMRIAERQALERALERAGGNRSLAARLLRVSRSRLYAKLEDHGLL
jgi:two-component system response regulator AtoC